MRPSDTDRKTWERLYGTFIAATHDYASGSRTKTTKLVLAHYRTMASRLGRQVIRPKALGVTDNSWCTILDDCVRECFGDCRCLECGNYWTFRGRVATIGLSNIQERVCPLCGSTLWEPAEGSA